MKRNIKPLTPWCGLCKKLYSYREDDGSGLCPRCKPVKSEDRGKGFIEEIKQDSTTVPLSCEVVLSLENRSACKDWMTRAEGDFHVRFCEKLRGEIPWAYSTIPPIESGYISYLS